MERDIILEKVREADMVLVGLGEDFNGRKQLKDCPGYLRSEEHTSELQSPS